MSTTITFSQPLLKTENPSCCSAGVSIELQASGLIPFTAYNIHYNSIGPGFVAFASNNINFVANTTSKSINNIVYLEGSTNFIIKATITKLDENNNILTLSEDIFGIDCGGIPPNRPTPTSSVTPTATPTKTPTNTPSVTPTISLTPSITPTISNSPTNTPTISNTPSVTPTISNTPTNTVTPSITPTLTVSATPTVTPTVSRGTPKATMYLGQNSGCGSDELVLYADIRGLLPNTTYKYNFSIPDDFDTNIPQGQFTTKEDQTSIIIKDYLIYNRQNTQTACNIKTYGLSCLLYNTNNVLISTAIYNLYCDSSNCDCPTFRISGPPAQQPVFPNPTSTPVGQFGDIEQYPRFLCPTILTKKKVNNSMFVIDTLTDFSYEINLNYSFYGSPEKISVYTVTGELLYSSEYVGSIEKDDDDNYIFCAGLDRRAHSLGFGSYDLAKFNKPHGSRYLVCVLSTACEESSEWKIAFSCGIIPTPTPTPTQTPEKVCPPPPSPTPSPEVVVCQYRFNNFIDTNSSKINKISTECSLVEDIDATTNISIDKTIDSKVIGNSLVVAGVSTCIGASYDLLNSKIALAKIKNKSVDSMFGFSGTGKITHSVSNDIGARISAHPKKLISQGSKFLVISQSYNEIVISRHFASNGFVDISFGNRGYVYLNNIDSSKIVGFGNAVEYNNKIILALEIYDTNNRKYAIGITSIDANSGRLDTTFGTGGIANIDANLGLSKYSIKNVEVINNSIFLVAQNKDQTATNIVVVVKTNTSGIVDTNFYDNGMLKINSSDLLNKNLTLASEPNVNNCLINSDGIFLSVVYNDSNISSIFKYGYTGGKKETWTYEANIPNNVTLSIDNKYNASVYDATTKSWYIAHNLIYTGYSINSIGATRKGLVNIKTLANPIKPSDIDITKLDPPLSKEDTLHDLSNIIASYTQIFHKPVVIKCSLDSGVIGVVGPADAKITDELVQSSLIASLSIFNDSLYVIGFGGDDYNYSFMITKWDSTGQNKFSVVDTSFGKDGYLKMNFDDLCIESSEDTEPPFVEDPCFVPTPTPTQQTNRMIIESAQSLCVGTKPSLRVNLSLSKPQAITSQYIIRLILKDTLETLVALDLNIPKDSLSVSGDIDLTNVASSNINKICQLDVLDVSNSLVVSATRTIVLSIPTCS